jgi:predicted acylesterase/phospholipase RssA
LVLQGGGTRGAYEAGAFNALVDVLGKEARYDLVSGVSVGGISASLIALFKVGDEKAAGKELRDHWLVHSTKSYKGVAWWKYVTLLTIS